MSLQTEIEAITGSISSITSEATQYCKDGNVFVQRIISQNPALRERLTTNTDITNGSGFDAVNSIDIVSVTRQQADSSSIYKPCKRVTYEDSYLIKDSNSIYFASVTDPRYWIEDGTLFIYPTPTALQKSIVKHITPVFESSSVAATLSSTSIDNLPSEYFRGIVLYAALQVLQKFMNNLSKPSSSNLTTISAGDVTSDADRRDITKWLDIVGDYIQNEDVELASSYLSKMNVYLQNYQTELTGSQSQYQWYESQYFKTSKQFIEFLSMFTPTKLQPTGVPYEAAGND